MGRVQVGEDGLAGEGEIVPAPRRRKTRGRVAPELRQRKSRAEAALERMERKLDTLEGEALEAAQREFFAALLNQKIGIRERAELLIAMARMKGEKTVPIAFRAINAINGATKVVASESMDAAPMFVLPVNANISARVLPPNDADQIVEGQVTRQLESGEDD